MMLKYGLDEWPPWGQWLAFGLQWFVFTVPPLVILGKVVTDLQLTEAASQVLYLQRLSLVAGITMIIQIMWGHRLPLVLGPSSVLLVGIIASRASGADAVYSSILFGGVFIVLLAITGLFGRFIRFFTPRVIAVILLLVAVTLIPTILNLILAEGTTVSPLTSLLFVLMVLVFTFLAHRFLSGIWKSTLMLWTLIAGWLAFIVLFGHQRGSLAIPGWGVVSPGYPEIHLTFDPAVVVAFIMCFIALSFNDLGSIQAVGEIINPSGMRERITRGLSVTGLGNILSGLMGVIGPVNFSGSPGMIVSTACASRFALLPAALGLLIAAFFPALMGFIAMIPSVVIGVVFIYIMSVQLATGLLVVFKAIDEPSLDSMLVVGLPLLLGTTIAFLPAGVINTFPVALRPLLGNGFIVGLTAALFMEHVVLPGEGTRMSSQLPAYAAGTDHPSE